MKIFNDKKRVKLTSINQSELVNLMKEVVEAGKYDCLFWSCYPKVTGKIKSDINRKSVRIAFQNLIWKQ